MTERSVRVYYTRLGLTPHLLADLWAVAQRTEGTIKLGEHVGEPPAEITWVKGCGSRYEAVDRAILKQTFEQIDGAIVIGDMESHERPEQLPCIVIYDDRSLFLAQQLCIDTSEQLGTGKKLRLFGRGYIPHFGGTGTPASAGINY